ncbi:hypothetical protein HZA41_03175 [Candidatus Peregrinibacteria bacterium]|nr:hypothetical protein [Candidatus Peregrinibacteria bacterium]
MKGKFSPFLFGFFGVFGMMLFYYLLLFFVTSDPIHPFTFFLDKWFFLGPLFLGFGFQMFLFQKMRILMSHGANGVTGASVGMSGVSMAACCSHHLAEIFPILGVAGLAGVMTDYLDFFLGAGVLMNFFGAGYMLKKLRHHENAKCHVH